MLVKNKETLKELFLILLSFLIGGLVMLLIVRFNPSMQYQHDTENSKAKDYNNSIRDAVDKIYDAVVLVQSYSNNAVDNTGTGFVYKVDNKYGYILTNEHVVSGIDIKVVFSNDEESKVELLGKDKYLDLAVLRVAKKYVIKTASIGKSKDMKLGDTVFTVGSPLGYNYRGSVTSGVLSGKDRIVKTSVSDEKNSDWVMKVLQVDASINPGNSGGPLVNSNGEVIGICTLKLVKDDVEGMGFAIPIEYAISHISSLEKNEKIKYPVLGVDVVDLNNTSSLLNHNIKIPTDIKEGVVVLKVKEKSGASKSGIKKGDVITKVDGTKIKDKTYLKYELYQHKSGDIINITYMRNNKEKNTTVKLG